MKINDNNPFDDNDNNNYKYNFDENIKSQSKKDETKVNDYVQENENQYNKESDGNKDSNQLNEITPINVKSNMEENLTTYQFDSVENQLNYSLAPHRKQFANEEFIFFIETGRIIPMEEINTIPILYLKEQASETPQYILPNEVVINAGGLINGNRNSKDGIVVFCKKEIQRNSSFICDYELDITDDLFYLPYIFVIYYYMNCYFITPHQSKGYDNYLPLIQLSKDLIIPIKDREIFSIGSVTLLICSNNNGGIEITNVGIFNENVENKPTIWLFDKSKNKITLGKGKNCDISFPEDKVLSRVHCTLYYESNTWIMKDGCNNKGSTNGTFLFCLKSFRIINNMSIRLLNSDIVFELKSN